MSSLQSSALASEEVLITLHQGQLCRYKQQRCPTETRNGPQSRYSSSASGLYLSSGYRKDGWSLCLILCFLFFMLQQNTSLSASNSLRICRGQRRCAVTWWLKPRVYHDLYALRYILELRMVKSMSGCIFGKRNFPGIVLTHKIVQTK